MNTCPSILELTEPQQLPPQLAAHVAECVRCRGLRAAWEAPHTTDDEPHADDFARHVWPHEVHTDIGADPVRGAIHSVWGPETGELLVALVLDVDDQEALVLPVSPDVHLAGDWDLLLDDDVLPYPSMAEVWNHLYVLREQLVEQLAELSAPISEAVDAAVDAFDSGADFPSTVRQGPAILTDTDPRLRFRDEEAALARAFTEPWRALHAAPTLGGVIRSRLEERELDIGNLGRDTDIETGLLERIGEDREDLHAQVPVSDMERLIRHLQLPPSVRLAKLIRTAVYENVRESPTSTGVVRARRRRNVRSAELPLADANARNEIADRYVARLMQRLEHSR